METRASRRRAATRERIVTVAMELFAERGVDAVTVAEIAEAADIGKGTFFTHFPTKAAVFGYLGEQVTEQIRDALEETSSAPAPDRLRAAFSAAAAWVSGHAALFDLMVRSRSFTLSADAGSANQRGALAAVAGVVAQGIARGEFRADARPDDAALVLFSAYLGTVLAWTMDPEGRDLDDRLSAAVDLVVRGLE